MHYIIVTREFADGDNLRQSEAVVLFPWDFNTLCLVGGDNWD